MASCVDQAISFLSSLGLPAGEAAPESHWRVASGKLVHGLHQLQLIGGPSSRLLASQTAGGLIRHCALWRPAAGAQR
jgi:hypothetical protein